jgi:Domain of unknown function (DUF4389)
MAYPVHTRIDHVERQSRLATFFKLFLAIPHLIVLAVLGIVAAILLVVSWFAVLFVGRVPRGIFRYHVWYLSYMVRFRCWYSMLCSTYPSFGGGAAGDGYPIYVDVEYAERLSRLTTFFRLLLAVPAYVVLYLLTLLENIMAFFAWWTVLFLGRLPKGMFEVMELPQRYNSRVMAYYLLITDAYPWFQSETEPDPEPWQAPGPWQAPA